MKVQTNISIHNRFDIMVQDKDTGEIKQTAVAYNNIVDAMWTRLCNCSTFFSHIQFGTGNGTLSAARTTLFTFLGGKAATLVTTVRALPTSSIKKSIVLNPEEFVGSVLTEVAVAYQTTTGGIVTHALIKDAEGNQISITKTDKDIIIIYATIFASFNLSEGMALTSLSTNTLINYLVADGASPTGSFRVGSCPYELPSGAAEVNSIKSTSLGISSVATWVTDIPNKKRSTALMRFGADIGNGNIAEFGFESIFRSALPNAIFSGQAYNGVSVGNGDGIRTKFLIPSKNVKQSTLSLYIDGVENLEYTKELIYDHNFITTFTGVSGYYYSCCYSADSNTVAFGGSSLLKVYDRVGELWVQRPTVPIDGFGKIYDVSLSADGNTLAFVAESSVHRAGVYDWIDGNWVLRDGILTTGLLSNEAGNNGRIEISANGNVVFFGIRISSTFFMFVNAWDGIYWNLKGDYFTTSTLCGLAISETGDTIGFIIATKTAFLQVKSWSGSSWITRAEVDLSPLPASSATNGWFIDNLNTAYVVFSVSPWIVRYDWSGIAWVRSMIVPEITEDLSYRGSVSADGTRILLMKSVTPYFIDFALIDGAWVKKDTSTILFGGNYGNLRMIKISPNNMELAVTSLDYFLYYTCDCRPRTTQITFPTPPNNGAVITADYVVDGVHKTPNYVIDASLTIQYGEPV